MSVKIVLGSLAAATTTSGIQAVPAAMIRVVYVIDGQPCCRGGAGGGFDFNCPGCGNGRI